MIPDRVKRDAGRSWDRIRADAAQLEKRQPGAGERYLLDAAAAVDAWRARRLSGLSDAATGRPR